MNPREPQDDQTLLAAATDLWLAGALVRVPWQPDDTPWREWLGVTRGGVEGHYGWAAALYLRRDLSTGFHAVLGASRVFVPQEFVAPRESEMGIGPLAWTPESQADRQAQIQRLQTAHAHALSTPLASEGNISPLQLHRMSDKRREQHGQNLIERLAVDSMIKHLNQSNAELAKEDRWWRAKLIRERITAAEQRFTQSEMVGRGKNGKLKPTWVKILADAQAELDKWKPVLAEIERQST